MLSATTYNIRLSWSTRRLPRVTVHAAAQVKQMPVTVPALTCGISRAICTTSSQSSVRVARTSPFGGHFPRPLCIGQFGLMADLSLSMPRCPQSRFYSGCERTGPLPPGRLYCQDQRSGIIEYDRAFALKFISCVTPTTFDGLSIVVASFRCMYPLLVIPLVAVSSLLLFTQGLRLYSVRGLYTHTCWLSFGLRHCTAGAVRL